MSFIEFLIGMGGDPQAVSAEYLDLVKLSSNSHYEAMSFMESQTLNKEETTTETDVLTSLVSYLFSPFVFIMELIEPSVNSNGFG